MKKLSVLFKRTYGDFDIAQDTAVAVGANKAALEMRAVELNATLTKAEIAAETKYIVEGQVEFIE